MSKVRLTWLSKDQREMFFPAAPKRFNVFPCGRRWGKTRGATNAAISWMLEGMPVLWGDTINGNIDRYVERYFVPTLEANEIRYRWQDRLRQMTIGSGFTDFRSSDNPGNWEGFGYRKVILNEAGIILGDREGNKGPYLYANTVLPMMLDYPESELYAIGVPKGKKLKSGQPHPFYQLWEKVGVEPNYRGRQFSSYDNKRMSEADIKELEDEIAIMSPGEERQEIHAEFRDGAAGELFAHCFDKAKHIKACLVRPFDIHHWSIDFNVHPFCAIMGHAWQDGKGFHAHICSEVTIRAGTIDEMADRIKLISQNIHLVKITGDKGGEAERIRSSDNISLFEDLRRTLGLSRNQMEVKSNPRHKTSRDQCNFTLAHHPDFAIDPGCKGLIADLETVEIAEDGEIVKADRSQANQRADYLDAWRYWVNTYLSSWIEHHRHDLRRTAARA